MRPKTSADIHRLAIQQAERDALSFIGLGSMEDARRIAGDLRLMIFGGATVRECVGLDQERSAAVGRIDAAMGAGA